MKKRMLKRQEIKEKTISKFVISKIFPDKLFKICDSKKVVLESIKMLKEKATAYTTAIKISSDRILSVLSKLKATSSKKVNKPILM